MSKGTIIDYKVKVKTSDKLNKFIANLNDCNGMPINIIKIYEIYSKNKCKKNVDTLIEKQKFNNRDIQILQDISFNEDTDFAFLHNLINNSESDEDDKNIIENNESIKHDSRNKKKLQMKNEKMDKNSSFYLTLNDLKWLNEILNKQRKLNISKIYLHELLEGCNLILPKNETILRSPDLEARCQKLKQEQDNKEYRNMTKNVDSTRRYLPDDSIGYQIKAINRQLIAVLQFIFSVIAGFVFGFLGVELIIGNLDFGFRLLLGIICALVIALAEIYFLAKKLLEYDEPLQCETSQGTKLHQE